LQRLQTIKDKATRALRLLESKPLSVATQGEIRNLAQWIKDELRNEHDRMLLVRTQKTMSMFELSIYSPTIEETWKKSGISRLNTDGALDRDGRSHSRLLSTTPGSTYPD
jgi:sugar-specific transcriptional regulator TrmB